MLTVNLKWAFWIEILKKNLFYIGDSHTHNETSTLMCIPAIPPCLIIVSNHHTLFPDLSQVKNYISNLKKEKKIHQEDYFKVKVSRL